jgi:hypothetical protein
MRHVSLCFNIIINLVKMCAFRNKKHTFFTIFVSFVYGNIWSQLMVFAVVLFVFLLFFCVFLCFTFISYLTTYSMFQLNICQFQWYITSHCSFFTCRTLMKICATLSGDVQWINRKK